MSVLARMFKVTVTQCTNLVEDGASYVTITDSLYCR